MMNDEKPAGFSQNILEGHMAEWLFGRSGRAQLILDEDCFRNRFGAVVGWLVDDGVYSKTGMHIGWFERGVIYDQANNTLGFTRDANGYTPARPGLAGVPGMPGFAGRPGRSGLAGRRARPGYGGWSQIPLDNYFDDA